MKNTRICPVFLSFLLIFSLWTGGGSALAAASSPSPTPKPKPVPLGDLALYSEAVVLMDADSGQILVGRAVDKAMFPASTTKILTALVAIEKGTLSDTIVISQAAIDEMEEDASLVVMEPGEEFTLEQLLYGLLLASGNDAAYAIAEHVGGTYEKFIDMMNEKAAELGAVNTHFTTPHGYTDVNHVTTAQDLALIMRAALQNPVFVTISGTGQYAIPPTNKQPEERRLNNTHRILKPQQPNNFPYDGAFAGKTGYTAASGHTLVTAARRDDCTLIAVVMNSPDSADKYVDTIALFDYGFKEFLPLPVTGGDFPLHRVTVSLTDASLWQAGVTAAGTLRLRVHRSLTREALSLRFTLSPEVRDGDAVDVFVTLPDTAGTAMYTELGRLPGTVQLMEELSPAETPSADGDEAPEARTAAAEEPLPEEPGGALSFWTLARNILLGAVAVVALLFIVLLLLRIQNIRRYRRRYGRKR